MSIKAGFKEELDDFRVSEVLGFEAEGSGQHLMLLIEKKNLNTQDIVKHLSGQFKVHPKNIGYSGLKDKKAITQQYFTVDLAGKDPGALSRVETGSIRLLASDLHLRKLKIGTHQANKFIIKLRHVEGDKNKIAAVLQEISKQGLPNYFGTQRFGNDNSNLDQVKEMFAGKVRVNNPRKKGMLLSAARSFLFNKICEARVQNKTWNQLIQGDVVQIEGSGSVFLVENLKDDNLQNRLNHLELHPTASLFGEKGKESMAEAKAIEAIVLSDYPDLTKGLLAFGATRMRRSLRMKVYELTYEWQGDDLILSFTLAKGLFATTLIDALLLEGNYLFPDFVT